MRAVATMIATCLSKRIGEVMLDHAVVESLVFAGREQIILLPDPSVTRYASLGELCARLTSSLPLRE
jgi:hypothetical protein